MAEPLTPPVVATTSVSDWTNRRAVIFTSLWFCAAMTGTIILTGCLMIVVGAFAKVSPVDPGVLGLLSTALYTIAFFATSIIGSYVFGVNFDWANTRQHIVELTSAVGGSGPTVAPASAAATK